MKRHPSPLKAIRLHCLWCCFNQPKEIRLCGASSCPSQPLRMGKRVAGIRPLTVIKEHCKECGGWEEPPKRCEVTDCALFPFRLGKNPNRAGMGGNPANLRRNPPTKPPIQERTPAATCLCSSSEKTMAKACSEGRRT